MSEHVKRTDPANLIFIVHRLDRETSGLLVFAKSEEIQSHMQRTWKKSVLSRKYVAVTEGRPAKEEGTIEAALAQNKNLKVYVDPEGEPAVTQYRVIASKNGYSLLELSLETGKKNQIRAHLEHIRTPIAGDKKYGAQTNPAGRVCLHAMVLDFIHPVTGEEMRFSTPVPRLFTDVLDKKAKPHVTRSVAIRHPDPRKNRK
jgi:23S rRNA pseudouridine1911/1915/1917 synthase